VTGYVNRVRSLLAGITPGKWLIVKHDLTLYVESENDELNPIKVGYVGNRSSEPTAAFIAEAPAAVTHLLARLDAVEALSGKLSEQPEHRDMAARIRAAITREGA
jgi:hypothetical protein